jgi:putative AlgH/UPF0301 family transcriptional regulator
MKIKALIATPKIKDSYFHKSTILMIKENKDSYIGLILNKIMEEKASEIWECINPDACIHKNNQLRNGGPLYGAVTVIHKIKKYAEDELFPKTYLSIHPKNIEKIIQNKTKPYEMYVGYCAWSPTQLSTEMVGGDWWMTEPDDTMIFGDNYDNWTLKKEEQNKIFLDKLSIKIQNHLLN